MRTLKYLLSLPVALFFAGCTLPAMMKMAKEQGLTVDPNPLEVHNGLVEYKIGTKLPVKMLKKGTLYTLNSFYKYGESELAMDPISFKAEDYPNSDTEQPSVEKSFSFPYQPMYKQGTLEIEGTATKNAKSKTTPRMPIATGLITTSMLVQDAYYAAYADHGYNDKEELMPISIPDFIFKQGNSVLQKSEIKSDKGKQLDAFIASKNVTKKISITGTHSPEGTESTNERLSQERAAAIEAYFREEMDKYDYKDMAKSIKFMLSPVVKNWDLFKELLAGYDGISADEKLAYTNIIDTGDSFEDQQKAIEKLPSYKKVFKNVYPYLRAAKTTIMTVKKKKTAEEISVLAKQIAAGASSADNLSFEEMMYAASLTPSLEEKEKIYMGASKKGSYANAHNNLGAVYLSMAMANPASREEMTGKASAQLALAAKIEETPEVHANLATVSLMRNNPQKALDHAKKSLNQANENVARGVNGVKGAAEIHLAKYTDAIQSESSSVPTAINFFNKGLAQLLSKNYSETAESFNEAIEKDADFSLAYYAMAIASARTDNQEGVVNNLTKAIKMDPSLKKKALTDLEFAKWAAMDEFTAMLK